MIYLDVNEIRNIFMKKSKRSKKGWLKLLNWTKSNDCFHVKSYWKPLNLNSPFFICNKYSTIQLLEGKCSFFYWLAIYSASCKVTFDWLSPAVISWFLLWVPEQKLRKTKEIKDKKQNNSKLRLIPSDQKYKAFWYPIQSPRAKSLNFSL